MRGCEPSHRPRPRHRSHHRRVRLPPCRRPRTRLRDDNLEGNIIDTSSDDDVPDVYYDESVPGPALRARHTDPTVVIDDYDRYVHIDRVDYDNLAAHVHNIDNPTYNVDILVAARNLVHNHDDSMP